MMLENVFSNVLEMSLSSSFLIAAVLVARIALRKSSKLFRKALWGLVAFKLVVPFSFESALSLVPHQSEYVPDSEVVATGVVHTVQSTGFDFKEILCYIWLAVFALFSVYGIVSFLRLKHKISDAVLLDGNVFQSEKVESPFVFGIFKPKIYLSYDIKGENLDYVLKHEKTHIKYFDHITKLLGFAILCVHWFNPLVWVSYVLFCKDVELACDEAVVKDMTEDKRKGYALALCDIGINKAKISACPVAFGEVSIKERVKSALTYKKIGKIAVVLSVALCVTVAVCFMTSPESNAVEKTQKTVEETPKEETSVLHTEIVAEPVTETEPTTEPTTESVTEETTEKTEVYVEQDPYAESRERLLAALNKNKTTIPKTTQIETTDTEASVAYDSLQNGNFKFNTHNVLKEESSYDIDVVEETTFPRSLNEIPGAVAELVADQ